MPESIARSTTSKIHYRQLGSSISVPSASISGLVLRSGSAVRFCGLLLGGSEGRQGIVYSIATSQHACLKLCKNERAAKQFRRELLGVRHYDALGVEYPEILGADGFGRWLVKERWHDAQNTGESVLAVSSRRLPECWIHALHRYVKKFEQAGLCADWMPSNVVFTKDGCATFETSVWPIESQGWTFGGCFLPLWLPDGVQEASLDGFPPYKLPARHLDVARNAWMTDPTYETWRKLFKELPALCVDWWST